MMGLTNRQLSDTRLSPGETLSQMVMTHEVSWRGGLAKASGTLFKSVGGTWREVTSGSKLHHPQDEDWSVPPTTAQTSS